MVGTLFSGLVSLRLLVHAALAHLPVAARMPISRIAGLREAPDSAKKLAIASMPSVVPNRSHMTRFRDPSRICSPYLVHICSLFLLARRIHSQLPLER